MLALAHLLVLAGLRGRTEEHDGHDGCDDDEAHGDLHLRSLGRPLRTQNDEMDNHLDD